MNEIPSEMKKNMTNGRRWWTPKYNNSYDKKSGDKSEYDECEWKDPSKFTDIIGSQSVCDDFNQLFPCMGEKAFTGEHVKGCMIDQFKKAGCKPVEMEILKEVMNHGRNLTIKYTVLCKRKK